MKCIKKNSNNPLIEFSETDFLDFPCKQDFSKNCSKILLLECYTNYRKDKYNPTLYTATNYLYEN